MYNIYVTNKSKGNVYVRLQSQKISTLNERFDHELDKLTAQDNLKDKTKSSVNSYLARWGFSIIPEQVTMPFLVEVANGETRLYASLYASSKLWAMDYEVNCSRYGCVFVNSKSREEKGYYRRHKYVVTCSSQYTLYLSQANPSPVWIPGKKGNHLNCITESELVVAGIDAVLGKLYFGRSHGTEPCKVSTKVDDWRTLFDIWQTVTGEEVSSGEILKDTGFELVQAKIGDPVPPNTVVGGVSDSEGTLYIGRVGGKIPCSISTEDGRIKYFYFFTGQAKKVESGEIIVLTK